MDYFKKYLKIIKTQQVKENGEDHHVIPRSCGGTEGSNVVKLSLRGHFIAHWLLFRFSRNNWNQFKEHFNIDFDVSLAKQKMTYAFWIMSHTRCKDLKINSKTYKTLRNEFKVIRSKQMKKFRKDPESVFNSKK